MNIFVLHPDPVLAARMQCDKHVVKMPTEAAQLLSNAFNGAGPYALSHSQHPCSRWVTRSVRNFEWLTRHGVALCDEYWFRYGKVHGALDAIEACAFRMPELLLWRGPLTPFHKAMPDDCDVGDVVRSYRRYYKLHKRRFARWTRRLPPDWWLDDQT